MFKKKKNETYIRYDWEQAFEAEIDEMRRRRNYGEITQIQYELWQEDCVERIRELKRKFVGEMFDEQMGDPVSILEQILP